jgi:hypothetical protein
MDAIHAAAGDARNCREVSFLDNLENNLKSLESREETDPSQHRRRDSDQHQARAVAPWLEKLKNSEFTRKLMQQATRAGFQRRTKVNIVWIGSTLRFEARNQRLELRPAADGVSAVILRENQEVLRRPIDLDGDPEPLIGEWMPFVDERKRQDEEAARAAAELEEEA